MKKNSTVSSITIASWTHRLSLSLMLLGCCAVPSWAQIKTVEIVDKPTVKDDNVTLRIKVSQENERPVMGLTDIDFQIFADNKEIKFKPRNWKSPEETTPPPAWIIVLIDMSGSMGQPDSQGTSKLTGAIQAVQQFTKIAAQRGGNTQIAIAPFGEPGKNCPGYEVNSKTLDEFFPAGDFKLQNYLDYLGSLSPCASTNLYEPLEKAVRFLSKGDDSRFTVSEDNNSHWDKNIS